MLLKSSIIIKYIEHINYLSIPVSKVYFTIVYVCTSTRMSVHGQGGTCRGQRGHQTLQSWSYKQL